MIISEDTIFGMEELDIQSVLYHRKFYIYDRFLV